MKRSSAANALPLCLVLAVAARAQTANSPAQRPSRPAVDRVVTAGCPAPVPPATGDSLASASDFIELQRLPCADACPAYTVRVRGDGQVSWQGDSSVEVKGNGSATIDDIAARALMQRVADRGFFPLCSRYTHTSNLGVTYITTLSIAGRPKQVQDTGAAAPSWLREMDDEIDRVADSHRWRHGSPSTETFGSDRLFVDTVSPKIGVTRLMKVAARGTRQELADFVANTATDLNVTDSSGWSPLMYAAQVGTVDAVSTLLAARADPTRRSNEGETALFAAVSSTTRPEAKVRLLTSAGININAQDHRGATALMIAARHFSMPNLLPTLLQLGADPTMRDRAGRTALDYLHQQETLTPDPARASAAEALLHHSGAVPRSR